MFQKVQGFVGPIVPNEVRVEIHPSHFNPVWNQSAQMRHRHVDGALLEPQFVPGPESDMEWIVRVRQNEFAIPESDLDQDEGRAAFLDVL